MLKALTSAASAIQEANYLVITAGSGLASDSGLPNFRHPKAFWKAVPKAAKMNLTYPEMSTPSWFHKDEYFAWGFFGWRYYSFLKAEPHEGYFILKKWAESKRYGYTVFTSNTNGHFQRAGFSEDRIQENQGSDFFLQCVDNHKCIGDVWPAGDMQIEIDDQMIAKDPLPKCPHCNGLARPNVSMFGDWGWVSDRTDSQTEKFEQQYKEVETAHDRKITVVEVGAGLTVPTVRRFSESFLYKNRNSTLVRINPKDKDEGIPGIINLPFEGLLALKELDSLIS